MKLCCVVCGSTQDGGYHPVCTGCGSLTNPVYELDHVRLKKSDNPFVRFSGLLPVKDKSLLPVDTGYTPTIEARSLGRKIGVARLYLKNETVLPTGTTKYRMAAVALPYLHESGVKHFCTSSTGNSSTAYAALIPDNPELQMTIFTASDFRHRVNYRAHPRIGHYLLRGASFAEAFDTAGGYARMHGYTGERGFFNPGRREGLKLAFFEAADQVNRPIDCYVQAVSSAMGVWGTFSGARELLALKHISRLPRLICVQQNSCAPMANAWMEDAEAISERHIVRKPKGIAEAILRGNPSGVYPYVRSIVQESRGTMTAVTDEEIRQARRLLLDEEGMDVCFSAATALAGLIQLAAFGHVDRDETVLANLTGRDRAGESPAAGLEFTRRNGMWICDQRPSMEFPAAH